MSPGYRQASPPPVSPPSPPQPRRSRAALVHVDIRLAPTDELLGALREFRECILTPAPKRPRVRQERANSGKVGYLPISLVVHQRQRWVPPGMSTPPPQVLNT